MGLPVEWIEKFAQAGMTPVGDCQIAREGLPVARGGVISGPTYFPRPNRMGVVPGRRAFVELPVPPSTNHLFANVPGKGRVKTKAYREWIEAATWCLTGLNVPPSPWSLRLTVTAGLGWTEARDVDNAVKPIADLIVSSGLLTDDCSRYVRRVTVEYDPSPVGPKTRALVRVQVLPWSAGA